jgi:GNAT superfamily N-acetyltransferase
MAEIHVRLTGPDDISAIAALRAQWTGATSDATFERHVAGWLEAEGDRRLVFLATLAGAPAGMASMLEYHRMPRPGRLRSHWGYVGNMFVPEDLRNQGIGSTLLAAVIAESEARGYARLVLSPTERAVPFYERAGFVSAGAGAGDDRMLVRVAQPTVAANSAKTST